MKMDNNPAPQAYVAAKGTRKFAVVALSDREGERGWWSSRIYCKHRLVKYISRLKQQGVKVLFVVKCQLKTNAKAN